MKVEKSLKTENKNVNVMSLEMEKILGKTLFDLSDKKNNFKLKYISNTNLYVLTITDLVDGTAKAFTNNSYVELLLSLLDSDKSYLDLLLPLLDSDKSSELLDVV